MVHMQSPFMVGMCKMPMKWLQFLFARRFWIIAAQRQPWKMNLRAFRKWRSFNDAPSVNRKSILTLWECLKWKRENGGNYEGTNYFLKKFDLAFVTLLDANSVHGLSPKTLELTCMMKITKRDPQAVLPDARLYSLRPIKKYPVFLQRTRFCSVFQSFACRL